MKNDENISLQSRNYSKKKKIHFTENIFTLSLIFRFAPSDVDDSLNSTWLYNIMLDYLPVNTSDEIEKTIMLGGYYTASPRKGLRVIVLNDNVCELQDW